MTGPDDLARFSGHGSFGGTLEHLTLVGTTGVRDRRQAFVRISLSLRSPGRVVLDAVALSGRSGHVAIEVDLEELRTAVGLLGREIASDDPEENR